jgi:hypothetical protein
MSGMEPILVRKNERHDVAIRGRFAVAAAHATIVRLSKAAGIKHGTIDIDIVDLSSAGLGFLTPVFIPKHTRVTMQVAPGNGSSDTFEARGIVRRVVMTDRRPMYYVGISFDAIPDTERANLNALLAEFGAALPDQPKAS